MSEKSWYQYERMRIMIKLLCLEYGCHFIWSFPESDRIMVIKYGFDITSKWRELYEIGICIASFYRRWDQVFYIHNFSILDLRNVGLPISEVSTVRISPLSFVLFRNIHLHHLGKRFPVNIPLFVSLLARISGSQRAISPLESWRNWAHFLLSFCLAQ